jgi:hypothetical protein
MHQESISLVTSAFTHTHTQSKRRERCMTVQLLTDENSHVKWFRKNAGAFKTLKSRTGTFSRHRSQSPQKTLEVLTVCRNRDERAPQSDPRALVELSRS